MREQSGTIRARSTFHEIDFHPTGVIAAFAFACALIAGKLEGLNAEQLVMAQGIALSMAAGTREYSTEDIERVEALIPQHAVAIVCVPVEGKKRPASPYAAAQFSIPFRVAQLRRA